MSGCCISVLLGWGDGWFLSSFIFSSFSFFWVVFLGLVLGVYVIILYTFCKMGQLKGFVYRD
jgi:hypothetical protein